MIYKLRFIIKETYIKCSVIMFYLTICAILSSFIILITGWYTNNMDLITNSSTPAIIAMLVWQPFVYGFVDYLIRREEEKVDV